MKICAKCKFEKNDVCFSKSEFKIKAGRCKSCVSEHDKKYYQENSDKLRNKSSIYYKNNTNNALDYQKIYRKNNKEKIKIGKQRFYQENKEKIKLDVKCYQDNNKEKINIYKKDRRKNDTIFKLHVDISNAINQNLKENNLTKNNKSINELLPYTMEELKKHLENHPQIEDWMRDENGKLDWSKRGVYNPKTHKDNPKWQIDHETPKSKFNIEKEGDKEFQECWGLKNLRPYCAKKNIKDGNRR